MRRILISLLIISMAFMLACCASTRSEVRYVDTSETEMVTVEFGSTDLHTIAEEMVDSLLASMVTGDKKPVIFVSRVKNKTTEHIDTEAITNKIKVRLIKSGLVKFTAAKDIREEVLDQLEYQAGSGLVDPNTGKDYGKQIGADYILYGDISSIVKERRSITDIYYVITLNLVNIETGIIEWAEETEFRKQETRQKVGF